MGGEIGSYFLQWNKCFMQAVAVKILNYFCQSVQFCYFRRKKNADITCIHTKCNNHHLMHTQSVSKISNLKNFLWTWLPRKRKYSSFQFFQNPKFCLTIFYATSLKLRHVGHMYKSHFFPIFWLNIYLQ